MVATVLREHSTKMRFSGHETFPFRYGWLKKGVDAVGKDGAVFSRDDALVRLGVGKNMVRAIRHWCIATGVIEEDAVPQNRGRVLRPTRFGAALLADGGWDPYLEDAASLFLLHWHLVRAYDWATAWHLGFLRFREQEWRKDTLAVFLRRRADDAAVHVADGLLERDVDCFVRTYTPSRNAASLREETMDCPFVELGLLRETAGGAYRFGFGPKPALPAEVFGYALLTYHATHHAARATLGIGECVYDADSPGQAFKLDENSVVAYIEALERITDGAIGIDETAGIAQVYLRRAIAPWSLLVRYYEGDPPPNARSEMPR